MIVVPGKYNKFYFPLYREAIDVLSNVEVSFDSWIVFSLSLFSSSDSCVCGSKIASSQWVVVRYTFC